MMQLGSIDPGAPVGGRDYLDSDGEKLGGGLIRTACRRTKRTSCIATLEMTGPPSAEKGVDEIYSTPYWRVR